MSLKAGSLVVSRDEFICSSVVGMRCRSTQISRLLHLFTDTHAPNIPKTASRREKKKILGVRDSKEDGEIPRQTQ
jgi:hypothetical protein